MTPTETQRAHAAGADAVKIFPAGTLGPAYLKAIASPLSHIPFLAVGGINDTNIADFLARWRDWRGCGRQFGEPGVDRARRVGQVHRASACVCAGCAWMNFQRFCPAAGLARRAFARLYARIFCVSFPARAGLRFRAML